MEPFFILSQTSIGYNVFFVNPDYPFSVNQFGLFFTISFFAQHTSAYL